jgi:hypothetical protein
LLRDEDGSSRLLDVESLRELVRLVRELEHEKQTAVNRARLMPWTR